MNGKISGNISYPEALGNGMFTYKLLLINVPIHIQLVAPLEFLFSSGRPWFYVLAMLNILLMLSIYHLPGLRFQLRAVKGHTVRDVAAGHCLLRFLALLILPIVVVALLSMGGIGIRGTPVYMSPWNEVELWGAVIAGAFLLSTLVEAIRWFHLFRQST